MTRKTDAVIVKLLLEGNFMTVPRMKVLIKLTQTTEDYLLKTRIEDFLEVIERGDTRFFRTYSDWEAVLKQRKESLVRFADLAIAGLIH